MVYIVIVCVVLKIVHIDHADIFSKINMINTRFMVHVVLYPSASQPSALTGNTDCPLIRLCCIKSTSLFMLTLSVVILLYHHSAPSLESKPGFLVIFFLKKAPLYGYLNQIRFDQGCQFLRIAQSEEPKQGKKYFNIFFSSFCIYVRQIVFRFYFKKK